MVTRSSATSPTTSSRGWYPSSRSPRSSAAPWCAEVGCPLHPDGRRACKHRSCGPRKKTGGAIGAAGRFVRKFRKSGFQPHLFQVHFAELVALVIVDLRHVVQVLVAPEGLHDGAIVLKHLLQLGRVFPALVGVENTHCFFQKCVELGVVMG